LLPRKPIHPVVLTVRRQSAVTSFSRRYHA
jgi:hypothetical protein